MKYLKKCLLIATFLSVSMLIVSAQDYTGTWCTRQDNNVLEDDTFIILKEVGATSCKGQLIWNGSTYNFIGENIYRNHNMLYSNIPIKIYRNGKMVDSAILHLYPIDNNRLDFIYNHSGRFASIYNMYCTEIATAQALARLETLREQPKRSYDQCVSIAKKVLYAMANGDVSTLKHYLSTKFYRTNFPYSDAYIRKMLLSVPKNKRDKLINHVNQSKITTIPNNAGDVVTVIFTNIATGKDYTMQLIDEYENGDWKVSEYAIH